MDHGNFAAAETLEIADDIAGETGAEAGPALAWATGRVVRVCPDAECGFLRAASGTLVYFSFGDVLEAAALRPSARVRYQPAAAGIPKAMRVATF